MKYIIRKSLGLGGEHRPVARVEIDMQGKLQYMMLREDAKVESVLMQAQKDGGLSARVPFSFEDKNSGTLAEGLKRVFIKVTDEHFASAVEDNVGGGLMDKEET